MRTLLRKGLNYQIQSTNDNYVPKTVLLAWSTPTIDQKSNPKHSKPHKNQIALLAINSLTVYRYLDFDLGKFDHQKGAFCDKISHKCLASDVISLVSPGEVVLYAYDLARVVIFCVVIHGVISEPVLSIG